MRTIIYILIAILLVPVAFASRESNVGVFAWIGIIGLIFTLVALSVREEAATPGALTTVTGPIVVLSIDRHRVSAIVDGFPFAGRTEGWMDVQIGGTQAFMKFVATVVDGEVVTAAGVSRPDFQILALHSPRTATTFALAEPGFRRGEFTFHVVIYTVLLVPIVIGIFVLRVATRGYNRTCEVRRAIDDAKRLAAGPGGPSPAPFSLDGSLRPPPAP